MQDAFVQHTFPKKMMIETTASRVAIVPWEGPRHDTIIRWFLEFVSFHLAYAITGNVISISK